MELSQEFQCRMLCGLPHRLLCLSERRSTSDGALIYVRRCLVVVRAAIAATDFDQTWRNVRRIFRMSTWQTKCEMADND